MINTKSIVIGALLSAIAALFQIIPVLLSEIFVFLTMLSAVPIYIVSRINPRVGVLSYLVATMIIMLFSVHEASLFLCTNGIVGISLGTCGYYKKQRAITLLISPLILTITLSILNYGVGIPIFGGKIPGVLAIQLGIIFFFSLLYNVVYYYFATYVFNLLKNRLRFIE